MRGRFVISTILALLFIPSLENATAFATVAPSFPGDNCFVFQGTGCTFAGSTNGLSPSSGEYYTDVQIDYLARESLTSNIVHTFPIANIAVDSTYHNHYIGTTTFPSYPDANFPYAYYTLSGSSLKNQYGPYFRYTVSTNLGNSSVAWRKASIVLLNKQAYQSMDTTFYYTMPDWGYSSFRDASTGNVDNYYTYNCLAYAFGKENTTEGWIWPFCDTYPATRSHVISYANSLGYTADYTTNHPYAKVIAYGYIENGEVIIKHFARVVEWDSTTHAPTKIYSKWGGAELIESTVTNPFTSTSGYGVPQLYFTN